MEVRYAESVWNGRDFHKGQHPTHFRTFVVVNSGFTQFCGDYITHGSVRRTFYVVEGCP